MAVVEEMHIVSGSASAFNFFSNVCVCVCVPMELKAGTGFQGHVVVHYRLDWFCLIRIMHLSSCVSFTIVSVLHIHTSIHPLSHSLGSVVYTRTYLLTHTATLAVS